MSRYKPVFVRLDQTSFVIPFNGLTMREIYSRFVKTGQRPVENTNSVGSTEEDPYNSEQDIYDRAVVNSYNAAVAVEDSAQISPEVSDSSESSE